MQLMTVGQLREELNELPEDLPVLAYDLSGNESFPIERVDPTISDRIDLNFTREDDAQTLGGTLADILAEQKRLADENLEKLTAKLERVREEYSQCN